MHLSRFTVCASLILCPLYVHAACDNFTPASGQTSTCNALAPNPTTTNIQALTNSTNVTMNILAGSALNILRTTSPVAVSIDTSSSINNSGSVTLSGGGGSGSNRGAALLGTGNANIITNAAQGVIITSGAFNDGMAANGNGNTLINNGSITTASPNAYGMSAAWLQNITGQSNNTLINTGFITTNGSSARATSILGQNGKITNSGTLLTTGVGSNAAYMQGNGDALVNSGTIHTTGSTSDAVFSNTAGSNFTATITNAFGGQIISDQASAVRTLNGATTIINAGLLQSGSGTAINGGTGNVSLILQTGSSIIGLANGGAGNNTVTLQGTGTASNAFINFQTLFMQGNDWTWQGSGTFANSFIQSGSFNLHTNYTGNVTVSPGANLLAGGGFHPMITPFPSGPAITVTNGGVIDLTNGGSGANDSLTIVGNYVGNNGTVRLDTVLGNDASPSDRLIISGGNASGASEINITNLNGVGGLTQTGILVVQAENGATTTDDAFTLSAPVAAGPYEYLLFKDANNNWYLRSASLDSLSSDSNVIPLYRVETPLYSAIVPVFYQTAISLMGTFHDRRGEQTNLVSNAPFSGVWLHFLGENIKQDSAGDVSPSFEGSLLGAQLGLDIYARKTNSNHSDHAGVFITRAHANGNVHGFALGQENYKTGKLNFNTNSVGIYWTHVAPSNWYVDGNIMNTWFNGNAKSIRDVSIKTNTNIVSASLEGGYPFAILPQVSLEPEAQIIWQHMPSYTQTDTYSKIKLNEENGVTGRIGARLKRNILSTHELFQPYLDVNLWRNFSHHNKIIFDTSGIIIPNNRTALQIGGGLTHVFSKFVSGFISANYVFNFNGETQKILAGNAGINVAWN